MSLGQDLAPHLPFLRRYGRALTGSQVHGDNFVRATLETIVAQPDEFPRDVDPRLGLYRTFHAPPGLVLADIQLADDSSGIDAVKDILAEFSVPVIFITAFPERLLTGTRPEPTFLITKPFQRATVKAAISQALFFDAATVPA